jgi:DNA replicative helicase MCM subunit Mcm2 (Cdc46/Mcm family)
VVRCSSIIPDLKRAYFRCFVCAHGVYAEIERYDMLLVSLQCAQSTHDFAVNCCLCGERKLTSTFSVVRCLTGSWLCSG